MKNLFSEPDILELNLNRGGDIINASDPDPDAGPIL